MSHEMTEQPAAAAASAPCPLHLYGCGIPISQDQLHEHCYSREHIQSMIDYVIQKQQEYYPVSRALMAGSLETNEPPNQTAAPIREREQFFRQLFNLIIIDIEPPNTTNPPPNASINTGQIYNITTSAAQPLILRQDRTTDHATNRQSNQAEVRAHNDAMRDAAHQTMPFSTMARENHPAEQHRDALRSLNVQKLLTAGCRTTISILETALESKPVSTDGCLIWTIDNIIEEMFYPKGPRRYIDSPPFQTSMNGNCVWARLVLQNPNDRRFMSIYVHLNIPFRNAFQAIIKFALVDQAEGPPWQHRIERCSGSLANINDCLGVNDFIEQNIIHIADSRYVRDGSICLIVKIEQTAEERFTNHPPNIQDALLRLQSIV